MSSADDMLAMLSQLVEQKSGFNSTAEVIEPGELGTDPIKKQGFIYTGTVLDRFFGGNGIPRGCTGVLSGPPGCGKTRTIIQVLVGSLEPTLLVLSEEKFYDERATGRDDMRSRIAKETDDPGRLEHGYWVLESQCHLGQSWVDFMSKYKEVCEQKKIKLVLVDSVNCLDDNSRAIGKNLAELKSYNHQQGITCLVTGQVRDTGAVMGGKPMQHIADVVWHIEDLTMTSKDMAAQWGVGYRETIQVMIGVKCNVVEMNKGPKRVVMVDGFLEVVV